MLPGAALQEICNRAQVIVLSNRQPYSHELRPDGEVEVTHSASGLVHAVEPLLAACGGVWVAHGSGSADRRSVDEFDRLNVPADNPQYRLRRVWLTDDEYAGYYYGFANDALWPLCHRAFAKPVFRAADLDAYWAANARFVDAVCEESVDDSPIVLVQDYHFAFAPAMLREQLPHSTIVTFWHVPWPERQRFSICPWGSQLLNGLLGSSIVGFQTDSDRQNFAAAVRLTLEARVNDAGTEVLYNGRTVALRVYAASIAWTPELDDAVPVADCRASVCEALALPDDVRIAVGVDRLDYTKGIEEKLLAVEQLLEMYQEYQNRLVNQSRVRHRRLLSDHPARGPSSPVGRLAISPRRRRLCRQQSARRHESGVQGVRAGAHRRARDTRAQHLCGGRPLTGRRAADQSLRCAGHRRRDRAGAGNAGRGTAGTDAPDAQDGCGVRRPSVGRRHAG